MASLILLAVILLVISFTAGSFNPGMQRFSSVFRIGGIILLVIGLSSSAFRVIQPGMVGVQVFLGKIYGEPLSEGLNVIIPFATVDEYDIKTRKITFSSSEGESGDGGGAIEVLSADGLSVSIDMTLNYKINPAQVTRIRKELGPGTTYVDVIVVPTARTRIRENAANYNAVELYSAKREEFQSRIYEAIKRDFEKRGIILEELLIRNIALPPSVKAAIEAKINAEQEAQKMQFVLQKEQQEAERKRVEAQGIADYQTIISRSLTDKQLQYEQIKAMQELVKSPNSKVIFMGGGKGAGASVLIGGN